MTIRKLVFLLIFAVISIVLASNAIPLILALLTAMILEPIVLFFMRHFRISRLPGVSITYILFLVSFGVGSYWLGALLIVQSVEFAHKLPAIFSHIFDSLQRYVWVAQRYYELLHPETIANIQQVLDSLKNTAITTATTVTKSIVSIVAALPELLLISIVYLVSLFLISMDLPSIRGGFMSLFTPSAKEKVELVMNQLTKATVGFLGAQIVLSLMTYLLALIGLSLLNVKYAMLIALFIVIVDILPILGTGSFIVPWAVYQYAVHGDSKLAIGLLILFAVLTVIRRIVEPKILGSSLGISALAALASLYIGFQLIGFFGLILGPAVVIIVDALLKAGFIKIKIDF